MASIGDIWLALQLQGAEFQASAKREGAKAGEAAGAEMSKGISSSLSKIKFGASFVQGLGIGAGVGAFHALTNAIDDVVNAIPDLIHQGEAFGLTVDDIADKTGASAETASRFAGTLTYLGISTSGLGMSLKTLSVEIVNNEAKFAKLGIQTRDSNGNLLDTITILNNVRTYLSGAGDGATKMALAADLLGRSAGDLIDFLNLTDEQAAALTSTLDGLGVTMNQAARRDAESLMRETNLLGLAWQGFANILFSDVAPAIRTVIGGATQFIKEHGAEIRATLIDMTNAVLGFVAGLVGLQGMTPFQTQLDALGGSAGNATLSFEQWAQQTGRTIPKIDKATSSTKAGTDAIDNQIRSIDRQIERVRKRDDAEETVFQRTMRRLSAEYGAQLDALDLAEKQIAIADRRRDLNERLNQAQLDLARAQRGGADGVNAQDVSDAMRNVADIRAQQAENERRLAVDAQRERLQGVQSYIEDVAKIEAESDNKRALANTLKRRETKLTAELAVATEAKNADAVKDITARLEAVKTAEARTQQAIRNGDRQSELAGLKAQLEAQRRAIQAAGSGQSSDNKKLLAELKAQYQAYLDGLVTKTGENMNFITALVKGSAKGGTGLGGAITAAFADGQVAGETFRKWLAETLLPAIKAVVDALGFIVGKLNEIGSNKIFKFLFVDAGSILDSGSSPGGRGGPGRGGTAPEPTFGTKGAKSALGDALREIWDRFVGNPLGSLNPFDPGRPPLGGARKTPIRAAGGPVTAGMPYVVGERRPEVFVPGESGRIIPSIAAMRDWMPDKGAGNGWSGGAVLEVHVHNELDGRELSESVSRIQDRQYRR